MTLGGRAGPGAASTVGAVSSGPQGHEYRSRIGGLDGFLRVSPKDMVSFQHLRSDTLYPQSIVEGFAPPHGGFDDAGIVDHAADELYVDPAIEAKPGRNVNVPFDHDFQRLEAADGKLLEASSSQLRLGYKFNVRMFVRGIFQWLDVETAPVLFAGYSDNQLGFQDVDLTRTERTFFRKIGYAWVL